CMAGRSVLVGLYAGTLLCAGCSQEVHSGVTGGALKSDGMLAVSADAPPDVASGGAPAGNGAAASSSADACAAPETWRARNDFSLPPTGGSARFAESLNALVRASDASPLAVSNHMAPHCVWMVAFSATDEVGASGSTAHAATFTEMFRHPSGLWTIAPQSSG